MVKRSPDPSWYADARKLRSEGLKVPAISRTLGVSDPQVRWASEDADARLKRRETDGITAAYLSAMGLA